MEDWRKVIAEYDAKVANGTIVFGYGPDGKFACEYPGRTGGDAEIARWLRSHLPSAEIDFKD